MKRTDRTIVLALPLLALAIGFYMLVIAPKRNDAAELQKQIDSLSAEISTAEAEISTAESARDAFARNYADVVKLGTAVPEDEDQSTLIHDLDRMGTENSLSFQSFQVDDAATASATTTATSTSTSTSTSSSSSDSSTSTDSTTSDSTNSDSGASGSTDSSTSSTSTVTSAAATEATAAALPIGATVGPAGLPVMPYTLEYFGGFFDMAGLFGDLDSRVKVTDVGTKPTAHGRLMTIDGFSFSADPVKGFPDVAAEIAVTTYMVPPQEGLSAGANPAGPAPLGSPEASVVASDTSSSTAAPTAAVTP
jgi:hypothetical protein